MHTKRPYRFRVHYYDSRLNVHFGASVTVNAYNRDEAIAEFKVTRYELTEVPRNPPMTLRPIGSDCDWDCSAGDE